MLRLQKLSHGQGSSKVSEVYSEKIKGCYYNKLMVCYDVPTTSTFNF